MSTQSQAVQVPRNVASAVVIKHEDVFFLAEHDGGVPAGNHDGFGLYYHDCRYLDGYELRIAGTSPNPLVSNSERGGIAEFELTNEKLQLDGNESVPQQTFGISLQRVIDSAQCFVHDVFTITNYDVHEHALPLFLSFHSSFEDIFAIRGLHPKKTGNENPPRWRDGVLLLSYDGADKVSRQLRIHFDPKPQSTSNSGAHFTLKLDAGQCTRLTVTLRIVESREQRPQPAIQDRNTRAAANTIDRRSKDWLAKCADVRSNNPLLNAVVRRCLLDLRVLRSSLDHYEFFSAGLPWYGTLFGRDSIIAALQTLAYEPRLAEQTIRLLAKNQGNKNDEWRDEQPGKILHELRRGELANLNEIPQTPYYGSVDSTPLFLALIGEHANWTGSLQLFNDLRPNIDRALHWIDSFGDEGHNGYLSYASKSSKGLGNQGWKDSGDSIMNADGSLVTPPVALVEVQGYVYLAKLLIADLYARSGDQARAGRLRRQSEDLKVRFNRDFWVDEKQFYAIAVQRGNRPAAVVSSNPGQALWTGIIDEHRVAAVVHGLTAPDMFSGWGVRTLSTKERRANPIGYHLGTVWPHDNSIIAAGLRRCGYDEEAIRVFEGILHAARHFEHYRLPEVFAGFSRHEFSVPVRYPVACHPQAWAAGSVPFMISTLLGLRADGFNKRLHVHHPVLPSSIDNLDLRRVKIGNSMLDLHFERTTSGEVAVDIANRTGDVQVEMDTEAVPKTA